MTATAIIAVTGGVAGKRAVCDRLVEQLADFLQGSDGAKLPIRMDDGSILEAPIAKVRVEKLASGQDALMLDLDVADEHLMQAPPIVRRGQEVTEAEREQAMPALEQQLVDPGNVQ